MFFSAQAGGFYDPNIHGENMPDDAVEVSDSLYLSLLQGQETGRRIVADADGYPVLAEQDPPTQAQIIARYEAELDRHLDAVAKRHGYDNRITFSLRAGYAGPYQTEGVAFAQWMDACYVLSNQIKNAVIAGEREMPSVDDFIAAMPKP